MTHNSSSLLKHGIVLLITISMIINCNESVTCTFSASGYSLDLSTLSNTVIESIYHQWTFDMKFCQNTYSCSNAGTDTYMAVQKNEDSCTASLARWTPNNPPTPTYSSTSGGTWKFSFSNGNSGTGCDSGRKLYVNFICSSSSDTYDSSKTTVQETSEKCTYEWAVYTKYACTSSSGGGSSSSSSSDEGGMSGGSWMLLIIFLIIFLYCVIGYAWNTKKHPEQDWKDYKNNTPHLSFWCLVPKWTWAGCCVTKEFTMEKYAEFQATRAGGAASLVSDEEDDA